MFSNTSGLHGHSSAIGAESFVIFSTNNPSLLERWLSVGCVGARRLRESHKGKTETSWIANAKHWPAIVKAGFVAGQESVLVLGPAGRRSIRPATLHFLDGRTLPVSLGYFVETPASEAHKHDAYSYDPSTDAYYTCRHSEGEIK